MWESLSSFQGKKKTRPSFRESLAFQCLWNLYIPTRPWPSTSVSASNTPCTWGKIRMTSCFHELKIWMHPNYSKYSSKILPFMGKVDKYVIIRILYVRVVTHMQTVNMVLHLRVFFAFQCHQQNTIFFWWFKARWVPPAIYHAVPRQPCSVHCQPRRRETPPGCQPIHLKISIWGRCNFLCSSWHQNCIHFKRNLAPGYFMAI